MYLLNHFISWITSPLSISIILIILAIIFAIKGKRKWTIITTTSALIILYIFSIDITYIALGSGLERQNPPKRAEEMPEAGAIIVLGGGMSANPENLPYPNLVQASDRIWHAARLYNAHKAPYIILSGIGEREASLPFLLDLSVPESAIICEENSRNTEENARFTENLLKDAENKKVLLVTSASHMPRSLLLFQKYAPTLEIIPAATDYEAYARPNDFSPVSLSPSAIFLFQNSLLIKEYIGYVGYKFLR